MDYLYLQVAYKLMASYIHYKKSAKVDVCSPLVASALAPVNMEMMKDEIRRNKQGSPVSKNVPYFLYNCLSFYINSFYLS